VLQLLMLWPQEVPLLMAEVGQRTCLKALAVPVASVPLKQMGDIVPLGKFAKQTRWKIKASLMDRTT